MGRNWSTFVQPPYRAYISLVKEFNVHAAVSDTYEVEVRGRTIDYSSTAINRFYKLDDVPTDQDGFIALKCQNGHDWDAIIMKLCEGRDRWQFIDEEPKKFRMNMMSKEHKAWFYFLASQLMPTTHHTTVDQDRALLLYGIITDKSFDLGKVISCEIYKCAENKRSRANKTTNLIFPSLITSLCIKAGCYVSEEEESLGTDATIDEAFMHTIKGPKSAMDGETKRDETILSKIDGINSAIDSLRYQ